MVLNTNRILFTAHYILVLLYQISFSRIIVTVFSLAYLQRRWMDTIMNITFRFPEPIKYVYQSNMKVDTFHTEWVEYKYKIFFVQSIDLSQNIILVFFCIAYCIILIVILSKARHRWKLRKAF